MDVGWFAEFYRIHLCQIRVFDSDFALNLTDPKIRRSQLDIMIPILILDLAGIAALEPVIIIPRGQENNTIKDVSLSW